jgi:adenylosuccinate lyase
LAVLDFERKVEDSELQIEIGQQKVNAFEELLSQLLKALSDLRIVLKKMKHNKNKNYSLVEDII